MPPKRKVKDTASPIRPSASRSRSTRTSKASPATDANESDALPARPTKRARGAASKATGQNDDLDDDFGGYGRGSSKPATIEQHLMDQNKKSKEFIQSFKEQVVQGRQRVHEKLARLKQDLYLPSLESHNDPSSSSSNNDLSDIYTTLQTAAAQSLSTKDNPLFEQTQLLLRLSRGILECHRTADRDSRAPELASPREMWKKDEEGMRKLLECGRLHGERVVEGWITPGGDQLQQQQQQETDGEDESGGEDKEDMDEAENLARGLFEWRRKGRGLKGEESWGVAARRQMVALAGLVRTLPLKE
ncbi:hypothetical protein C8A00DRAFT_32963 [Chaetomidium leptoderma]|uniref:Uncharacterized protein n=1 Tax=Chaetomidium leptoderma TaxID=669021 RepID=A0AAN6VP12_9PEZI|nr:hypothetical protein C8A00DRAFT_32963 [Chaetomidium leptoderma]